MSSMSIAWIVFACLAGGAVLGSLLRYALPEHHLSPESKDTVKLGMGLIATMGALVLGLMVSSAKSSYDAQRGELLQISARVLMLDRVLANLPDSKEARDALRVAVVKVIEKMWPEDAKEHAQLDPSASRSEAIYEMIQRIAPKTDGQKAMQSQAVSIALDIAQRRLLLFEQSSSTVSTQFLTVLVFWLSIIFVSFGLMAPRNATVVVTLLLCALAVSGAVFLILELDRPFDGAIRISSEPLRKALSVLGN